MANTDAIEYAQDQTYIWASNTFDVYCGVIHMYECLESDEAIADYLQNMIRNGSHESDWLTSKEGEQAAFGDADGVTLDDIDWADIIDGITDRKVEGK